MLSRCGDLAAFGERAEQRQAAVAEVVAAGAVVDEADDLEARARGARGCLSATSRPRSPAPAISTRLRPMPARQRRSSASRTSSRDA